MKRTLALLGALLLMAGAARAQFSAPTESYTVATADTFVVRSSPAILHAIIVEDAGTTDTVRVYDLAAESGYTSTTLKLTVVVADAAKNILFGHNGLWLRTGFVILTTGTPGRYTFVYE